MLTEYRQQIEETLKDFANGKTFTSIADVTFTEVDIKVDREKFEDSSDALSTVAIGLTASAFQYFNGASDDAVRVDIKAVDAQDGTVLLTAVYSDSFNKKQ